MCCRCFCFVKMLIVEKKKVKVDEENVLVNLLVDHVGTFYAAALTSLFYFK